jgi:Tfp pilus assembly protein PilF
VQISLGRVAEQQGDFEQAMAAYKAALRRDNRRADAYVRLAVLHDKQGKFRESAELYRKALHLRPGAAEIFCDMGYSLYLQRRWDEAAMNLRQAIAVNPEFPRAHNNLALLLAHENRLDDALAEFRRAGSKLAEAHLNLAFALTMDQRFGPARVEYERALALDPASAKAKGRAAELNALLAKFEVPPRKARLHDARVMPTSATLPKPLPRTEATASAHNARRGRRMAGSPTVVATAAPLDMAVRASRQRTGVQSVPDLVPVQRASTAASRPESTSRRTRTTPLALTRFSSRDRWFIWRRHEPQPKAAVPSSVRDGTSAHGNAKLVRDVRLEKVATALN